MKITFDIHANRIPALISALNSAADNAQINRDDADCNGDPEMVEAWTSDDQILSDLLAQVEHQSKGKP